MKNNTEDRVKLVKAMEYIARNFNDEDDLIGWLYNGVADGDISYGDLDATHDDEENLECYINDEDFADLMHTFLRLASRAYRFGGLYCDGVWSDSNKYPR